MIVSAGLCVDCGTWTTVIHRGSPMCPQCFEKRVEKELVARSRFVSQASSFEHWEDADVSKLFSILLKRYVSSPDEYCLERLEWMYQWQRTHNLPLAVSLWNQWQDYKLSPTFEKERLRLVQGCGGKPIVEESQEEDNGS